MKTLSVTDNNEVVSIQPHFYTEDNKEKNKNTPTCAFTDIMKHPLIVLFFIYCHAPYISSALTLGKASMKLSGVAFVIDMPWRKAYS